MLQVEVRTPSTSMPLKQVGQHTHLHYDGEWNVLGSFGRKIGQIG